MAVSAQNAGSSDRRPAAVAASLYTATHLTGFCSASWRSTAPLGIGLQFEEHGNCSVALGRLGCRSEVPEPITASCSVTGAPWCQAANSTASRKSSARPHPPRREARSWSSARLGCFAFRRAPGPEESTFSPDASPDRKELLCRPDCQVHASCIHREIYKVLQRVGREILRAVRRKPSGGNISGPPRSSGREYPGASAADEGRSRRNASRARAPSDGRRRVCRTAQRRSARSASGRVLIERAPEDPARHQCAEPELHIREVHHPLWLAGDLPSSTLGPTPCVLHVAEGKLDLRSEDGIDLSKPVHG